MAPILGHAELLGWVRRRWPQERVWAGRRGLPARHRPGWNRRVRRRHDRASWEVKLLVDHRERLVAERTPGQATGWAAAGPNLEQATSRRPGSSQRHSTAWLTNAAQEASRVSIVCQAQVAGIGSLTAPARQLDRERCHRVARSAPKLLALPGGRTLTTANPTHRRHRRRGTGPSAPAAPIASACRGWQPAAVCRPVPYRDHPAAPAGPARPTTSGAAPRVTPPAKPWPPPFRRRIARAVYRHTSSRPNNHPQHSHGLAEESNLPRGRPVDVRHRLHHDVGAHRPAQGVAVLVGVLEMDPAQAA
jgi:hypothetical protein